MQDNIADGYVYQNEKNGIKYSFEYNQLPLKRTYSYERGIEEFDEIIRVTVQKDGFIGRGECSPFPSFFNIDLEVVVKELINAEKYVFSEISAKDLIDVMESGPARNAIDNALLDYQCKRQKLSIWNLLEQTQENHITMYHTVQLDSLSVVTDRLKELAITTSKIKLKLGSTGDDRERLELVNRIIPDCEIIVDVNEGWTFSGMLDLMPILLANNVKMIEQPLPHGEDLELAGYSSPIPIFADESFSDASDFAYIYRKYDGINVKLDKVGGLTSALSIIKKAKKNGLRIMVGCLGGTSLSSAVGFVAAQQAEFVDLDNHLWLKSDCKYSLGGMTGHMASPCSDLWG